MAHFQRAILVGASSGIGAELARQLAADGCRLALLARREAELSALAEEIGTTGPLIYPHDVRDYDAVPALFQTICHDLGGLDLFLYVAGVMPPVAEDEYTFAKDRLTVEVNLLGAMAWCNEAAQRFAAVKEGTLVGIGSVAGDRGRRGNPAYAASKAALDTYLEALRNRTGQHGVRVVTIKPGPVRTPMTEGLSMPMMIPAADAARQILHAAERGVVTAYVPAQWRYIMGVIRSIPSPIFQKLNF
ncbi:MAG: SDR family NAD(P)-dependent oxidoreductase [Bacteroidia bacterium]|nr:SDR family NAD(P)-dependent oxidoreductase [Bacteroidia bacterium]